MHDSISAQPGAVANRQIRVFSLYVDFAAVAFAKRVMTEITRHAANRREPAVEMWKLDTVFPCSPIREMIAAEAAASDVLVIAINSLDQREPMLAEWLDSQVAGLATHPDTSLLVCLLGDEGRQAGELDWTVRHLAAFARRTGRNFVWQWMGQEAVNDFDWLKVTIEEFLARQDSAPGFPPATDIPLPGIPAEAVSPAVETLALSVPQL